MCIITREKFFWSIFPSSWTSGIRWLNANIGTKGLLWSVYWFYHHGWNETLSPFLLAFHVCCAAINLTFDLLPKNEAYSSCETWEPKYKPSHCSGCDTWNKDDENSICSTPYDSCFDDLWCENVIILEWIAWKLNFHIFSAALGNPFIKITSRPRD